MELDPQSSSVLRRPGGVGHGGGALCQPSDVSHGKGEPPIHKDEEGLFFSFPKTPSEGLPGAPAFLAGCRQQAPPAAPAPGRTPCPGSGEPSPLLPSGSPLPSVEAVPSGGERGRRLFPPPTPPPQYAASPSQVTCCRRAFG